MNILPISHWRCSCRNQKFQIITIAIKRKFVKQVLFSFTSVGTEIVKLEKVKVFRYPECFHNRECTSNTKN